MRTLSGVPAAGAILPVFLLAISGCVGPLEPARSVGLAESLTAARSPAPIESSGGLFYPLDVGNHWSYDLTLSLQITPTGGPPGPVAVINSTLDVDLVGTQAASGFDYVVQRETTHDGTSTIVSDYLRRQDRSGLFERDSGPAASASRTGTRDAAVASAGGTVGGSAGVARASLLEKQAVIRDLVLHGRVAGAFSSRGAAGPASGEITLLRYPLHAGASWHLREDPLFVYTVEAKESVALPAGTFQAWRIRIDSDLFGANDRVHVWYGRDGLIELAAHVEGVDTDQEGNVVGTTVSDQTQVLTGLALVGANAPTP